jgi:hypothetical protein
MPCGEALLEAVRPKAMTAEEQVLTHSARWNDGNC